MTLIKARLTLAAITGHLTPVMLLYVNQITSRASVWQREPAVHTLSLIDQSILLEMVIHYC